MIRGHMESCKENDHRFSQQMQEMTTPIFKSNQTLIFQMLYGPNLLPSSSSAFALLQLHPCSILSKEDNQRVFIQLLELKSWKKNRKLENIGAITKKQKK